MFFASPLQPILSSFAPMRPERSAGPGPAQARYRWLLSAGHTQELPGSWRIHPVPSPRSRIPASSSDLTLSAQQCRPHFADSEGTGFTDLSRLNHAASVPAAYASSGALPHPHARLASGWWPALAGRESNPLDSIEKFPSATSDFLLSQIYPGATAKVPTSLCSRHKHLFFAQASEQRTDACGGTSDLRKSAHSVREPLHHTNQQCGLSVWLGPSLLPVLERPHIRTQVTRFCPVLPALDGTLDNR